MKRQTGRSRLLAVLTVAALVWSLALDLGGAQAAQVTATWANNITGNWNETARWSGLVGGDSYPNNDASDTYSIVIDGIAGTGPSSVTLNVSVAIDNLTVTSDSALTIANNNNLTVVSGATAGTITNAGTIALSSSGSLTNLIIGTGGTVTLQGGGNIALGNNGSNRIYSNTAGSVLDNLNNTISGAGQILSNAGRLTLKNETAGIIDATGTVALTVSDFTGATTLLNTGILRSSNTTAGNGGLVLANTTVDNTGSSNGGRITAIGANTHVDLNSATIQGGTLTTSGGGVIQTVTTGTGTLDGSTAQVTITGEAPSRW